MALGRTKPRVIRYEDGVDNSTLPIVAGYIRRLNDSICNHICKSYLRQSDPIHLLYANTVTTPTNGAAILKEPVPSTFGRNDPKQHTSIIPTVVQNIQESAET